MKTSTPIKSWVYRAPPTIARFMESDSFGRLVCGPVGSGKTTGCLVELARRMASQQPAPDGRRYTRWAVIRQTLKDAKATVLKDARGWFGSLADWKVSDSTLFIDYGDINSEWMFIPLDDPLDVKRLLSTQLTGAFINEASEIDIALLSDIAGRCGRFPNEEFGACTWKGIFADTNMPVQNTPWAEFIIDPPNEWQVFRQPGGHTREAENLAHLEQTADTLLLPEDDPRRAEQGRKYYRRLMDLGTPDYVRRYVKAEFGRDLSGVGVFSESFNYDFHVLPSIEPVHGRMLIIGQDFGRNPWSIITQMDHHGALLVLEEVKAVDIGLEQHLKQHLIPTLAQSRYSGRPLCVVGDPSGVARDSNFELNSFDLLRGLGLNAERAPTNDVDPRIRSVESFLMRQVNGKGAILFDASRCPVLVQGMNGAYKYSRTREDVSRSLPDKNPWSHVCDALQYATLVAGSQGAYQWILGRVIRKFHRPPARPRFSALAWT